MNEPMLCGRPMEVVLDGEHATFEGAVDLEAFEGKLREILEKARKEQRDHAEQKALTAPAQSSTGAGVVCLLMGVCSGLFIGVYAAPRR